MFIRVIAEAEHILAYEMMIEYRQTSMLSSRNQGEPNDTNDDCDEAAEGTSLRRLLARIT